MTAFAVVLSLSLCAMASSSME